MKAESSRPVKYPAHRKELMAELADLPNERIAEILGVSTRTVIEYRHELDLLKTRENGGDGHEYRVG